MPRPIAILAAMLLLGGCGADPAGLFEPDPGVRESMDLPEQLRGAPDQDALDRLMGMARAHKALAGAAFTARTYARGTFGGKKPKDAPWATGAEWEGRTVWEVAYAPPATYRLKAVDSTVKDRVGFRALLTPTGATVRYPGLPGLIARKRDLQHADLLDFRGHALAHLTPAATIARLAGGATARLTGESRVDGQVVDLVEIPRTPAFDPEVAREVLGIERGTHVLRLHAMFDAEGRKVYEQQILGFKAQAGAAIGKLAL